MHYGGFYGGNMAGTWMKTTKAKSSTYVAKEMVFPPLFFIFRDYCFLSERLEFWRHKSVLKWRIDSGKFPRLLLGKVFLEGVGKFFLEVFSVQDVTQTLKRKYDTELGTS